MCSDPQEYEHGIGACRKCDECIAARRSGWVARGCAEKTQWQHALCVDLTYDDNAPGGFDAARMFAYVDVRNFVQRITAALRRIDKSLCVRFIAAGEQGDRNGRCHWHLVLYADYDLRKLGIVTIRGNRITEPSEMMTVGKLKRRLHWSLWAVDKTPLGFVTFREADEPNIAYSLSYALKDQFTVEKSQGTARIAKAENFATGLFRMSKRPAIGEAWLMQKLQHLSDLAAVIPNTRLRVPGIQGYWYPTGPLREKLLWGLRAINQRRIWSDLGEAPQWGGLLQSCKDNPSDLEILNGPEVEQITFEEAVRFREIDATHKARDKRAAFYRDYTCRCQACLCERGGADGIGAGSWRQHSDPDWLEFVPARGKVLWPAQIEARYGVETVACERCGNEKRVAAYPRTREGEARAADLQGAA